MSSSTETIDALHGHHHQETPVNRGVPTRIWMAEVVAVNPDRTVDAQPMTSRATKRAVPIPDFYRPAVTDLVLVCDLGGDPRTPVVLLPFTVAGGASAVYADYATLAGALGAPPRTP